MNEITPKESHFLNLESYSQAAESKQEAIWKTLKKILVSEAIGEWLATLSFHTKRAYSVGMKRLSELNLINLDINLQVFSQVNHNAIIDQIKLVEEWKEATRQARSACYISLTQFLDRRTNGIIRKAVPSKEGNAKTFFKVRQKIATPAMTMKQWDDFFIVLEKQNERDALAGKMLLEGGKRANEVLNARIEDIDWENKQVRFQLSKTKGTEKYITISYSQGIIESLKTWIGEKEFGYIFQTRTGNQLQYFQLIRSFERAGIKANIPFKVTTHVMRTSLVTFMLSNDFKVHDVADITGQSLQTVDNYNKSDEGDNASKKLNFF